MRGEYTVACLHGHVRVIHERGYEPYGSPLATRRTVNSEILATVLIWPISPGVSVAKLKPGQKNNFNVL